MKKNTILFCAFIFFSAAASADETLSWKDVFDRGLRLNPELANARDALALSEVAYKKSLLNFYPDISGSAGARTSDSGSDSTATV